MNAEAPGDHAVSGRTILVTGGAGFIGSHLAAALVPDNAVRVLDDLSTGRRAAVPDGVELVEGRVEDDAPLAEAMAGVDTVFHQAAVVSVARSVEEPVETHDVNAHATLRLLEHARREDARVVLASSAAIYGDPEDVPVAESHPPSPRSPYGVAKLAADQYARLYATLYDLPTVALRYFNVYGPGGTGGHYSGVIDAFVERALAGDPLTVHGDGTQTRDFVHVSDVVRANLAAAVTDDVGRAFNVGTGTSVSIRELAEEVRRLAGSDSPIVHDDPRPGDVRHSRADVSAARRALGYEPTVGLAEGLASLARLEPEIGP